MDKSLVFFQPGKDGKKISGLFNAEKRNNFPDLIF